MYFTLTSRYLLMPVPAGMSLPIITFSLRPSSGSTLPLIAASVSTRVVSWKEAADRKESVAKDALVIPRRIGWPSAGCKPRSSISLFCSSNSPISTYSPGSIVVSPASSIRTLRIIWRTITSMCLSLISTP